MEDSEKDKLRKEILEISIEEIMEQFNKIRYSEKMKRFLDSEKPIKSEPAQLMNAFFGKMYEVYDILYLYSYRKLQKFPREEKFAMTQNFKTTLSEIEELLVRVHLMHHKKTTASDLQIKIKIFERLISRAWKSGYINDKSQDSWVRYTENLSGLVSALFKKI